MTLLLDAFALIALLRGEPAAEEVETLLRRGAAAMTAINLAEALDVLQRIDGVTRERLDVLTVPLLEQSVEMIAVDEQLARDAASVRARRYHRTRSPLSLADCVLVAAATRAPRRAIATADPPLARAARAEGVDVVVLPDARGRRAE